VTDVLAPSLDAAGDNGLTDYETAQRCHLARPHIAGNRRKELQTLGLVERTDERRPTDTGSTAVVWKITEAGRELAAAMRDEERAEQTGGKGADEHS
jgi:hypothetical protein